MMFGFGDDINPLPETVDLVEVGLGLWGKVLWTLVVSCMV